MATLGVEFRAAAMEIVPDEYSLRVMLVDGREIAVPYEYFPRLRDASAEQRTRWHLSGDGEGIHWDEINEDIAVATLLRLR